MNINLKEHHLSLNVPVFVQVKKILESGNDIDYLDVIAIQEELEIYETQIRELRHQIFKATHSEMINIFVKSVDEHIEQEHQQ